MRDPDPSEAGTFTVAGYLAQLHPRLRRLINERSPQGTEVRRRLTRHNPLLFSIIYMRHHLRGDATGGRITFSEFHLDLYRQARAWTRPPRYREDRDAYIAPRDSGKSTMLFLLLPMWGAAHEWVRFIAALADSGSQAEQHLGTFIRELESNPILREDYPDLCAPATRALRQTTLADSRRTSMRRNGLVFMARGIDSKVLGMKVGERRPDLIILDDIEPGEATYSEAQVQKRLGTLQDVVLPLNNHARVILAGTVTMAGSIMHQLVKTVTTNEERPKWIDDENFRVHYYPAIIEGEDGTERSIWPQKWPLEELQEQRGTRSFEKNMQNMPVAGDGDYWTGAEYRYGHPSEGCAACRDEGLREGIREGVLPSGHEPVYGNTILSIDPAVTKTDTSDWTGFAVVSRGPDNGRGRVWVRHAEHRRVSASLRGRVVQLLDAYPDVGLIYIEVNQGGDVWLELLHDMPVPIRTMTQNEAKHIRAARCLKHYERGRVWHESRLPALEQEQTAYPRGLNDDVLDAAGSGILYFLEPEGRRQRIGGQRRARQRSYA